MKTALSHKLTLAALALALSAALSGCGDNPSGTSSAQSLNDAITASAPKADTWSIAVVADPATANLSFSDIVTANGGTLPPGILIGSWSDATSRAYIHDMSFADAITALGGAVTLEIKEMTWSDAIATAKTARTGPWNDAIATSTTLTAHYICPTALSIAAATVCVADPAHFPGAKYGYQAMPQYICPSTLPINEATMCTNDPAAFPGSVHNSNVCPAGGTYDGSGICVVTQ